MSPFSAPSVPVSSFLHHQYLGIMRDLILLLRVAACWWHNISAESSCHGIYYITFYLYFFLSLLAETSTHSQAIYTKPGLPNAKDQLWGSFASGNRLRSSCECLVSWRKAIFRDIVKIAVNLHAACPAGHRSPLTVTQCAQTLSLVLIWQLWVCKVEMEMCAQTLPHRNAQWDCVAGRGAEAPTLCSQTRKSKMYHVILHRHKMKSSHIK